MPEGIFVALFAFFFLLFGGVIGAAITLAVVKRRARLEAVKEERLRGEMAEEVALRVTNVLDQVMSRFESLEERLEFSEALMLGRGDEGGGSSTGQGST